jgi:glycosyltransferase involved in cell wall biosynthesis
MLENAVDPDIFSPDEHAGSSKTGSPQQGPLRISFVGRLVPFKALPLLLEAMAQLRAGGVPVQLEVVGEGPMAPVWRECAQRLGLQDCIAWLGARDPAGVAAVMRRSQVFCLPSVRESGGAVFLEAMAFSRPVIGMDFGGPAEILDSEIGWKIPMPDETTAIAGLIDALREAHQHPEEAARRGIQGRKRVLERYTREAKFRAVDALYARLVQSLTPEVRC